MIAAVTENSHHIRHIIVLVFFVLWLTVKIAEWLQRRRARAGAGQPVNAAAPQRGAMGSGGGRPQPARRTLNLDISQFKPISDAEFKSTKRFFGSWEARDRGRIPPADDKVALAIDRSMINHGIVTAEELLEAHRIQDRMTEILPQVSDAARLAAAEIQLSKDELKAEKKRQAEERRKAHEEAVKRRRETDIVFLGRGVSAGLADRRSNVEKLEAAGLPVLAEPADIARAMEISIPRLRWLAFHSEAAGSSHYITFSAPKRSGGTRTLMAPKQAIDAAQRWVLGNILSKLRVSDAAHGFVAGRSTLTNARPHVGRPLVANFDLKDFFPSITTPRVRGFFESLGYSPAAATVLALICTESPRKQVILNGKRFHVAAGPRALPQGACTSPALSTLIASRLDARLSKLAGKLGWRYTRYADDLTFSCDADGKAKVGYLMARVRHIAAHEGFAVNEKKTHVQRPHRRQTVTGIVVNERAGVPRALVRRVRAILHNAGKTGLAAQNTESIPNFKDWLQGTIAYIHMVNPAQGAPLREAFARLRD
ncbi:MAG: reverse transcriptase family protein [Candidatus Sumerlaeia bacterium]